MTAYSAAETQAGAVPREKSVFVVDDDHSMLAGIKRLLAWHGFPTELFSSSDALLRHDNFESAFCMILDIDLEEESGLDLHTRLANDGILLPVIYITGNDSEDYRSSASERGCLAYLTKPFPAEALIASIAKASASLG